MSASGLSVQAGNSGKAAASTKTTAAARRLISPTEKRRRDVANDWPRVDCDLRTRNTAAVLISDLTVQ